MKNDAFKPLLESGIINKETHQAITEAWDSKLMEAREEVRAELRAEFAQRHEHDTKVMSEALDKMIRENMESEIREFREDRKMIAEDRVKAQRMVRENVGKVNDFILLRLSEEIKELRAERQQLKESQHKLEQFVIKALAEEIKEFSQDKRAVVEAKVKLVREGKQKIAETQAKFVAENAAKVKRFVTQHMKREMGQLKEDIKQAKENNFGRKIFEAYMSEFSTSYLNEKVETKRLLDQLRESQHQLSESIAAQKKAQRLIESKEFEIRKVKESNVRDKQLAELTGSLNPEKAATMRNLLENVQTANLKREFDKYLPAVLDGARTKSRMVTEARIEVTGNKNGADVLPHSSDEFDRLKEETRRLAGMK